MTNIVNWGFGLGADGRGYV